MMTIRHILVPTDGSPCAKAAAKYACDLAALLGARVTLLQAFVAPTVALPDAMYAATDEEIRAVAVAASDELYDLATSLARPGLQIGYDVVEGSACDAILAAAATDAVDLVVMGTHGRHGMSRLLLGSVAERVVRSASCPVLTIGMPHAVSAAA